MKTQGKDCQCELMVSDPIDGCSVLLLQGVEDGSVKKLPDKPTPSFNMDELNYGAPIATLRSMEAISKYVHKADLAIHKSGSAEDAKTAHDAVSRGIITAEDAQKMFDM